MVCRTNTSWKGLARRELGWLQSVQRQWRPVRQRQQPSAASAVSSRTSRTRSAATRLAISCNACQGNGSSCINNGTTEQRCVGGQFQARQCPMGGVGGQCASCNGAQCRTGRSAIATTSNSVLREAATTAAPATTMRAVSTTAARPSAGRCAATTATRAPMTAAARRAAWGEPPPYAGTSLRLLLYRCPSRRSNRARRARAPSQTGTCLRCAKLCPRLRHEVCTGLLSTWLFLVTGVRGSDSSRLRSSLASRAQLRSGLRALETRECMTPIRNETPPEMCCRRDCP